MQRAWVWLRETKDYTCKGLTRGYFAADSTDGEAIPIRIPLLCADFGSVKYTLPEGGEVGDLELLYKLETPDILIKSSVQGENEPPGTFRLSNIQAADLSLHNEIPGSLEGIVARLVVETSSDAEFKKTLLISDEFSPDEEHERETNNNNNNNNNKIGCRRITLIASIHECGHLRDMLLFLKSGTLVEETVDKNGHSNRHFRQQYIKIEDKKADLTLGLPHWTLYFPWWLYSGRLRRTIQICLLLYTIFSVVWATWQLYRHISIIQLALQPIVDALKLYLSGVMEIVDIAFHSLTDLWMTFLSPLNIFRGIALTPLINALARLVSVVMRLLSPILMAATRIWRLISRSGLTSVVKLVVQIFSFVGSAFITIMWRLFIQSGLASVMVKPLTILVKLLALLVSLLIKVLSCLSKRAPILDPMNIARIRQTMGINAIKNNFRAIGMGLFNLFKFHVALQASSNSAAATASPRAVFSPSTGIHRRSIPVVYKITNS